MTNLAAKRADFQIHSPRDAHYKNWAASKMTLVGLREWADNLLAGCADRKLDCIGVTDHHDLWPGLVVLERARALKSPVWVFPGMEITSSSGLQAILLLDPSLFETNGLVNLQACEPLLNRIMTSLGQSISGKTQQMLKPTTLVELEQLEQMPEKERQATFVVSPVDRVDRELFGNEGIAHNLRRTCEDGFALLPNLEKNKHGIFGNESGRTLYQKAEDWFVGGIVGGDHDPDFDIIRGKQVGDWGPRTVCVLRTSDQRGKDSVSWLSDRLGDDKCTSWLMLSEPSTKSIRQALISGQDRRVFSSRPPEPSDRIDRITIAGADLFCGKDLDIELVAGLNCLIGGRGTGKSVLVSALVRAFAADADWYERDQDLLPWEARHVALFTEGGPLSGDGVSIAVEFTRQSSARYRIVLDAPGTSVENKRLEVLSGAAWSLVAQGETTERLSGFQPLFFLQGQMSSITGSTDDQQDLTWLIEGPIRGARATLRSQIDALGNVVREGANHKKRLLDLKARQAKVSAEQVQKTTERDAFLRLAKQGLSSDQQKLLDDAEILRRGQDAALRFREGLETAMVEIATTRGDLEAHSAAKVVAINALKSSALLDQPSQRYLDALLSEGERVSKALAELDKSMAKAADQMLSKREHFDQTTDALSKKASETTEKERTRREAIKKAEMISKELDVLQKQLDTIARDILTVERSGKIAQGDAALNEFRKLVTEYSKALMARAKEISDNDGFLLYVRIIPGGLFDNFLRRLKELCQGARVLESTWQKLEDLLRSATNPAEIIATLIEEMIEVVSSGGGSITEMWAAVGFSEKVFVNIVERTSVGDWLALAVVIAEDRVEVSYKRPGGKPIPILNASPGERAVELLKLALSSTAGPIVIDQPEDDLDNHFLADHLVGLVQSAKHRNQMVFSSHNANLVVHGDSDVVHVMDTMEIGGKKSGCRHASSGTIDQEEICEFVEKVMEGGRTAFEHRRRKYHETIEATV